MLNVPLRSAQMCFGMSISSTLWKLLYGTKPQIAIITRDEPAKQRGVGGGGVDCESQALNHPWRNVRYRNGLRLPEIIFKTT